MKVLTQLTTKISLEREALEIEDLQVEQVLRCVCTELVFSHPILTRDLTFMSNKSIECICGHLPPCRLSHRTEILPGA